MGLTKKILCLLKLFLLLVCGQLSAQYQQKIGDLPNTIEPSAVLELESSSRGFLPPRMSQAQRNAIVAPSAGLMIWCTDCGTGDIQFYNGNSWYGIRNVSAGGNLPLQSGGLAQCDGYTTTLVVPIITPSGRIWMDRNMGASRAATSATDYFAYGCLYQWGRGNDGHSSINWTSATAGTPVNATTRSTPAPTDTPGDAVFIIPSASPNDWRSDNNSTRWQVGNQVNNPCPTGYRVPTRAEILTEFTTNGITNADKAYSSVLKFALAGYRSGNSFIGPGLSFYMWTSSTSGTISSSYGVSASGAYPASFSVRATAEALRCMKDY